MKRLLWLVTLVLVLFIAPCAMAQNGVVVGVLNLVPTFEAIGVRAQFSGDADGDATTIVEYQKSTEGTTWHTAYDVMYDRRATIDGVANPYKNEARVSIVGLVPGTLYNVRATWSDSDGISRGANPATASTTTLTYTPPTGSGTTTNVSTNTALNNALSTANPGDIIHLNSGTFNAFTLGRSGNSGAWIVVEGQNDGSSVVSSGSGNHSANVTVGGNFVIIRKLTLAPSFAHAVLLNSSATQNVHIVGNTMQNVSTGCADQSNHYDDAGVSIGSNKTNIYVGDNVIHSAALMDSSCDSPPPIYNSPGEGVSASGSQIGLVVRNNVIDGGFRDGITLDNNSDIANSSDFVGNTVSNHKDDGVESKGGNINMRSWNNVVTTNKGDTCFAINQPSSTNGIKYGPMYVFRNTCVVNTTNTTGQQIYKGGGALAYFFHNSIDGSAQPNTNRFDGYSISSQVIAYNNIMKNSGSIISGNANTSLYDYNVHIVTIGGVTYAFHWNGVTDYATWSAFKTGTGQEPNGKNTDPLFTDSALHITTTSPAYNTGRVLNNFNSVDSIWAFAGSAPDMGAFEVVTGSPPTVASLSVTSGPLIGGTTTVLTGTNYTGVSGPSAVMFGGTNASSYVVNSTTQITAVSPAHSSGVVNVTVTAAGGTSAAGAGNQFTYVATPPTVTSITPTSGSDTGGTTVDITGSGFLGASDVKFGTTSVVTYTVNSSTSIRTTSPAGSGTVHITVITPAGTSTTSSADQFTYNATPPPTPPTVTGVSPNSGPTTGGTTVTITGTNLDKTIVSVKFSGTNAASFTPGTATSFTAVTPSHAAGVTDVVVTTSDGTSTVTSADQFTFVPVVATTAAVNIRVAIP